MNITNSELDEDSVIRTFLITAEIAKSFAESKFDKILKAIEIKG